MNDFEKVEKLRQHAQVSYEEAKEALEAANGDLLDAMIYLERQGKAKAPNKSVHSTSYDHQEEYTSVQETVKKSNNANEVSVWQKIKRFFKKLWKFLIENSLVVRKNGNEILSLPLLLAVIIILCFFWCSIIAMVVLLFFGFRYSLRGKNNLDSVNSAMDKAGDMAEKVKEDFRKPNNN